MPKTEPDKPTSGGDDPLAALLDRTEAMARQRISEAKEVSPFILYETRSGPQDTLDFEPAPTASLRRAQALDIGESLREKGVPRLAVVTGAWASAPSEDKPLMRPSEDPQRIEALHIEADDSQGQFPPGYSV